MTGLQGYLLHSLFIPLGGGTTSHDATWYNYKTDGSRRPKQIEARDLENAFEREIEMTPPAGGPAATSVEVLERAPLHSGLTVYDALLFGMILTWGVNPAALKWALDYMDPLAFNALRFLVATLVPVSLALLSKEGLTWQRGDGWKLFGLGLIGHGIYQVAFIVALNLTLAGNVALILSISPAFVAIFGAALGFERLGRYTLVGVALTLLGVALVVLGSGESLEFGPKLLGDLLTLAVVVLWALYTVLCQPLLRRYSAVKLNALVMPVGVLALGIVGTPAILSTVPTWPSVPPLVWIILVASALIALSASYIIWNIGIQKLGPTRTAIYSQLVPVIAAFVSFFVLHEPLGWQFWVGMAVVLAGVSLARFAR